MSEKPEILTEKELTEIEAREKAATGGDWSLGHPGDVGGIVTSLDDGKNDFRWIALPGDPPEDDGCVEADWIFLVNARKDIPRLLATVRGLREALRAVRHYPCPKDTNGDGDCGRHACPYCGIQIRTALDGVEAHKAPEGQP